MAARDDTPIRVLHVVLSLEPGGLERIVLDLTRHAKTLRQEVTVLCLESRGVLAAEVEAAGGKVVCLGKAPGIRLGTVAAVLRLLRQVNPHVIHTHQIGALFYAGPAGALHGVRVVVHTEHGKHYHGSRRLRMVGRIAARHADRFFCVSPDIEDEVRTCGITSSSQILTVPNGIDTRKFADATRGQRVREKLGIGAETPVVGTIGRLVEIKRQDLLIRAFAQVRAFISDAHLLVVGEGPLHADLRRLSHQLGVEPYVHFAGYQPNPEDYLGAMNVFTLTSRSEGMPLSVLEAWAAGVPVVVPRVGGLSRMVDHGSTGLLYEQPQIQELVDSIVRLLECRKQSAELADAALRRVRQDFDVQTMSRSYDRHYRLLLRSKAVGV